MRSPAFRLLPSLLLGLLISISALGQGSLADYERSKKARSLGNQRVFRDRIIPTWSEDDSALFYQVKTAPGRSEFIMVDTDSGRRSSAFDHDDLAGKLSQATGKSIKANNLPLRSVKLTSKNLAIAFQVSGKGWQYDTKTKTLSPAEKRITQAFGPKAKPRPSQNGGEETSITFVNETKSPIIANWMDAGGTLKPYGAIAAGKSRDQHTYAGHTWVFKNKEGKTVAWYTAKAEAEEIVIKDTSNSPLRAQPNKRNNRSNTVSPNGNWRASFRDHNLWITDQESKESVQLSEEGSESNAYSGRVYWSPDSKHVFLFQTEPAQKHEVHFVESSPKDQLQPKLHTRNYLKPGDRIAHPHPRLFSISDRRQIPINEKACANPWSINRTEWAPDGKSISFLYNQRGHQHLRLIRINTDGTQETIIDEASSTFIDYSQKTFIQRLHDTDEVVWMSERDGWNHLYLFDLKTGKRKTQLTKGNWVVRKVTDVDQKNRKIWFMAGGVYPGQDPYHQHLCRVNLDGSGFKILTKGDGDHKVTFSPTEKCFIDQWSRVDQPTITELRNTRTGKLISSLETADVARLYKTGWSQPERFVTTGRDGKTKIYGTIIKPTNFDSTKRYPVIENIYAGPHGSFVKKDWGVQGGLQTMAELGFIIVKMDGMGTNWRSKRFHDVAWKNIRDAGFPDRIKWIREAAKTRPWMDIERMGIYGGSAGGQNTLSGLLHHGDFYKAGVADCGCHDNRMDKIWWNEAWMGWPIDDSYSDSSNVTHAHLLQGKLMLIVGEMDTNVDPASTMQVVHALVKADKDFDLLVMPGVGHGAAGRPYASRRQMDFFVRHLHGKEPRWK
ncbi:prolyl oligopeptidase family serine peptidase [Verrucomicrobia bacterium]|nr:prolyl oligopeptidase family serine peptidase [Verrucomicrobiota bacterium]